MTGAGMSTSAYALGLACKSMSACRCLKQKSFSNKRTRQNLGKIFLLLVSTTSTVTLIGSLVWMFLQKIGHKISSQRSKLHQKGLVDEVQSLFHKERFQPFPSSILSVSLVVAPWQLARFETLPVLARAQIEPKAHYTNKLVDNTVCVGC